MASNPPFTLLQQGGIRTNIGASAAGSRFATNLGGLPGKGLPVGSLGKGTSIAMRGDGGCVGGGCGSPSGGSMRTTSFQRGGGTRDLSSVAFTPGNGLIATEFLSALTMVKGDPVIAVPISGSSATYQLQVQLLSMPTPSATVPYYNNNQLTALSATMNTPATTNLVRIGLTVSTPWIDAVASVKGSAGDPVTSLLSAAGSQLVRYLESAIAKGDGTGSPPSLVGLPALVANIGGRSTTSTGNIEKDARLLMASVFPTGNGSGEGPDCLVGSVSVLRALMATSTGQGGMSGWRWDERTGRKIYHYMGLPFYRLSITDGSGTAAFFAANLGATGVQLVYTYGTPSSYGFQVDELSDANSSGQRQFNVYGAFALMIWEPEAVFEVTNTPITTL